MDIVQDFNSGIISIEGIDTQCDGELSSSAQMIVLQVQGFQEMHEDMFMTHLLGCELYAQAKEDATIYALVEQSMIEKINPFSMYVYIQYTQHNSFNTITGEKKRTADNSVIASPAGRLLSIWNMMVDRCYEVVATLNIVHGLEPMPKLDSEIFSYQNRFGL